MVSNQIDTRAPIDTTKQATKEEEVVIPKISKEEIMCKVNDKKSLYSSLVRNGYILPPLKDPILTQKFMMGKSVTTMTLQNSFITCLYSSRYRAWQILLLAFQYVFTLLNMRF